MFWQMCWNHSNDWDRGLLVIDEEIEWYKDKDAELTQLHGYSKIHASWDLKMSCHGDNEQHHDHRGYNAVAAG